MSQSWQFVNGCDVKARGCELRMLVKRIISVAGHDMETNGRKQI